MSRVVLPSLPRLETDADRPILTVDSVSLQFSGVKALDDVSFEVHPGELFAVIGPNGAGKTSTFNILSGVYRTAPGGRVTFRGHDITHAPPHEIAEMGMSRTFQNIELFGNLATLDNLLVGRHIHRSYGLVSVLGWFGKARRKELFHRRIVEEIIDFLELAEVRKEPVALLPYGIQKRIELGRALALEPQLLLLDEPVAGMNQEETEDMARFIVAINDQLHVPIILVEHDMNLVMDLADRVHVLDFGRTIATGTPSEVRDDPAVIDAYLGAGDLAGPAATGGAG